MATQASTGAKFISLQGCKIRYELRGNGPWTLLLIHGAIGSANDFALQLDEAWGLRGDQFTIVAPDLPGQGRSSLAPSLKCEPTRAYYELCARLCAQLMAKLGHKTYALAGWGDGARIGSLLAARHQSRVDALLLWGFLPALDAPAVEALARTRNVHNWDPTAVQFYADIYGKQKFADLWREYVDFTIRRLTLVEEGDEQPFDLSSELRSIKCPTLVLYGSNDPIISYQRHVEPIEMQIYDTQLRQFKGAAHNLHQSCARQFNQVLADFVECLSA